VSIAVIAACPRVELDAFVPRMDAGDAEPPRERDDGGAEEAAADADTARWTAAVEAARLVVARPLPTIAVDDRGRVGLAVRGDATTLIAKYAPYCVVIVTSPNGTDLVEFKCNIVGCEASAPIKVMRRGVDNSPQFSNVMVHFKRVHPEMLAVADRSTSGTKHAKADSGVSASGSAGGGVGDDLVKYKGAAEQSAMARLILTSGLPPSIVENPSFRTYLTEHGIGTMSRRTVVRMLDRLKKEYFEDPRDEFIKKALEPAVVMVGGLPYQLLYKFYFGVARAACFPPTPGGAQAAVYRSTAGGGRAGWRRYLYCWASVHSRAVTLPRRRYRGDTAVPAVPPPFSRMRPPLCAAHRAQRVSAPRLARRAQ